MFSELDGVTSYYFFPTQIDHSNHFDGFPNTIIAIRWHSRRCSWFFAIPPRSMQQFCLFFLLYYFGMSTHAYTNLLIAIDLAGKRGVGRVRKRGRCQKGHFTKRTRVPQSPALQLNKERESKAQQMLGLPVRANMPPPLLSLFLLFFFCRTSVLSWLQIPHGCCPFSIYCCFLAATISVSVSVSIWSFKFPCSFQFRFQLQVQPCCTSIVLPPDKD